MATTIRESPAVWVDSEERLKEKKGIGMREEDLKTNRTVRDVAGYTRINVENG
jgi:hypothetical protein